MQAMDVQIDFVEAVRNIDLMCCTLSQFIGCLLRNLQVVLQIVQPGVVADVQEIVESNSQKIAWTKLKGRPWYPRFRRLNRVTNIFKKQASSTSQLGTLWFLQLVSACPNLCGLSLRVNFTRDGIGAEDCK